MTLPPTLTPWYWFNPNPPPFMLVYDRALLVVMSLLTLAGIVVFIYCLRGNMDRLMRKAMEKAGNLLFLTGLFGLLLYAFTYERVLYLSMRILWLPLAIWFVWEAWKLYKLIYVKIPEIRKIQADREQFEKWLPKKKG